MIKDNFYATSCYTLLFYIITRPEHIVLTADQSTLLSVFKDNFFCFHFSFRPVKLKFHATEIGSVYLKSLRNNRGDAGA